MSDLYYTVRNNMNWKLTVGVMVVIGVPVVLNFLCTWAESFGTVVK